MQRTFTLLWGLLLGLMLPTGVWAQPTSFTFTGDLSCPPAQMSFSSSVTGATAYSWQFQNGMVVNGQTASFTIWQPGPFEVTHIVQIGAVADTETVSLFVGGPTLDPAQLTISDLNGCAPLTVDVQHPADSSIASWQVDYGVFANPAAVVNSNAPGQPISATFTYNNQGFYGLTIGLTDLAGCSIDFAYFDTVVVQGGPCIEALVTDVACADDTTGSIDVTVTGGIPPYTYAWSNGNTTEDLANLSAGSYTLTITDVQGNTQTETFTLDATLLDLSFTSVPADCQGQNGSIAVTAIGGQPPYTYLWNTGATTDSLDGVDAGGYSVDITDANGCRDHGATLLPYADSCRVTVSGRLFYDLNQNCVFDAGDFPLNGFVSIQQGGSQVYHYVDPSGTYQAEIAPGDVLIGAQGPSSLFPISCPPNGQHFINGLTQDSSGLDFAFFPVSQQEDLAVTHYKSPVRPGFNHSNSLNVRNLGTVPLAPTVTFTHAPSVDFLSGTASVAPSSYDPATYTATWTLPTLNPGQHTYLSFQGYCDPSVALGTNVDSWATVLPDSADVTPLNNVDTSAAVVVGSFDPNDKLAKPLGEGPLGHTTLENEWFDYTVRFQNTGTDTAFFVVIRDTLDSEFQPQTVQMRGASHDYSLTREEDNILIWRFDHINLPDSGRNQLESNGFLRYQVKRFGALPLGTELTNRAAIYFDFNAPIITNTTLNTLFRPVSNDPSVTEGLTLYPNPSQGTVKLALTQGRLLSLELLDLSGKRLRRLPGSQQATQQVDLSDLAAGVYLLEVRTDTDTKRLRLIRE